MDKAWDAAFAPNSLHLELLGKWGEVKSTAGVLQILSEQANAPERAGGMLGPAAVIKP